MNIADAGQVDDRTTATGAANAASLDLGDVRTNVDIFIDVTGTSNPVVEVSPTGAFAGEEHALPDVPSYSSDTTDLIQYDLAYQYVRVYTDANLTELEIVGRGL